MKRSKSQFFSQINKVGLLICMLVGFTTYAGENLVDEILTDANEIYYSNPDSCYVLCKSLEDVELSAYQEGRLSIILAKYYLLTTDYESAEKELQNAKAIFTDLEDPYKLGSVYSFESILAFRLGDLDESRYLGLKSYEIALDAGDNEVMVSRLSNVIDTYLVIEDVDSAYFYLKKLNQNKSHIDASGMYFYYQNWGRYYEMIEDYEMALDHALKALIVSEDEEMTDSKATILAHLGSIYNKMKNFESAIKYANMSYAFSDANDLIYEKRDAAEVLLDIALEQQDFLSAYKFQKELSDLNQEILNIEKINNVKQVKSLLAIAEKEKIIADKDTELAIQEVEKVSAESKNKIFMFSLIALVLVLGAVAYAFVKTKSLNKIISNQHQDLEIKNNQISEALNDIEGSLRYSKLIQDALLPSKSVFQEAFGQYFVFFQPKEEVSGDFYWAHETDDAIYFCVADCTGHGVPGAMVSVVGINALDACLREYKLTQPAEILDQLAVLVEKTFSNEEGSMKDGMDLAFCKLEKETNLLTFAGANNPLYFINGDGLNIIKGEKQPIGKYDERKAFVQHSVQMKKGDVLYIFSDGYADQFGGPSGKKYMYKRLRTVIEDNRELSMNQQLEVFKASFSEWKKGYEQVDDVCLMGVRV